MRSTLITLVFFLCTASAWACEVCKKQQPKLLKGITHGIGPESNWDYLIVLVAVAVAIGTLLYSIRFLLDPKEKEPDHIKNVILNISSHE